MNMPGSWFLSGPNTENGDSESQPVPQMKLLQNNKSSVPRQSLTHVSLSILKITPHLTLSLCLAS